MNIIYFGDDNTGSTSYHRAEALRRLGHVVTIYNPNKILSGFHRKFPFTTIHYRTGYQFLQSKMDLWIEELLAKKSNSSDLIWVNGGEYFGHNCIKRLKKAGVPVILYNNDDPTSPRDKGRWGSLLKALHLYDLCATPRDPSAEDMRNLGIKNVLRIFMSYDEVVHHPPQPSETIPAKFHSDVAFIGTWMPNEGRHDFIAALVRSGLKVKIWGNWQKCPDKTLLVQCWQGGGLSGRDYVYAMAGAKVSLGLLSKGNRDQHTQRSLEIPYAGGLFCAERTDEHQQLYRDGKEAMFWSDTNESITKCKILLSDDALRESIRVAGMRRVRELKLGNEDVCRKILDAVQQL